MKIKEKGKEFFFFFWQGFAAYKVAEILHTGICVKKFGMAPIKGHVHCTHDQFNEKLLLTNVFSLLVSLFILLAHQKPSPLTHEGLGYWGARRKRRRKRKKGVLMIGFEEKEIYIFIWFLLLVRESERCLLKKFFIKLVMCIVLDPDVSHFSCFTRIPVCRICHYLVWSKSLPFFLLSWWLGYNSIIYKTWQNFVRWKDH